MSSPEAPPAITPWIDQMEVIYRRPEGLVGFVPLELIRREPTAVDMDTVLRYADSMQDLRDAPPAVVDIEAYLGVRTGQLSTITLAQVPSEKKALITDGFHRVPALEMGGIDIAFALVIPNTTMAHVTDLRIVSAVTQKAVRFARVVTLVDQAWGLTEWSETGLTAGQAFTLAADLELKGDRHNLPARDIQHIREWAETKSRYWKIKPKTLSNHLLTAKLADPELVQRVRAGMDSDFTARQLGIIVRKLPRRYDMQGYVADLLEEHTFTFPELTALSASLVRAPDLESAQAIFSSGSWRKLVNMYRPTAQQGFRTPTAEQVASREGRKEMNLLLTRFMEMAIEEGRLIMENAQLKGIYTPTVEVIPQERVDEEQETDWAASFNDPTAPEDDSPWSDAEIAHFFGVIEQKRNGLRRFVGIKFGILDCDTEDVVQDTAEKILKALKTGALRHRTERDEEWMINVIKKAAGQAAIDLKRRVHGRKMQRPDGVSIDRVNNDGEVDREGILPGVEDEGYQVIEDEEPNLSVTLRVLPALGEQERKVFVLHTFYGLRDGDVGQILGILPDTVAATLTHVRTKIDRINGVYK